MFLKRLWDTENKKTVWATGPSGKKCQLWTNKDGSKLYIYDASRWLVCNPQPTGYEYGPTDWKELDDQEVGYYESNEPTNLYSWNEGDEVSYKFKDYDGTVLKSGKVDEGTAPTPPADPTRSATAQYTYTFSWWNPTVGKIYKKTEYVAQYTSTVNEYTVSIASNDTDYGTVDVASVANVPYGTAISAEDNVLTIGEWESKTEVTATAEDGYVFSSWWELPATLTGNTSIQANFAFGPLQNYVLPNSENSLITFGDAEASNYVSVLRETDVESWDDIVSVVAWGLFEDDVFVGTYWDENENWWEYIFNEVFIPDDLVHLTTEWADATDWEWKSGVWSALQTYYATPNKANADAVITAIEATRDSETGNIEAITWTIPEPEPTQDEGEK